MSSSSLKILAISGSLRESSFNSAALKTAEEIAGDSARFTFADLSGIPLYDQDLRDKGIPEAVEALQQQVLEADAILFSTPEYNYSVSGVLKNAIDWLSRVDPQPFADKPVAVMSASMSAFGGARAQYDLRRSLIYLDAHFVNKPEVMISFAHKKFDDSGALTDEDTRKFIGDLLKALVEWQQRLSAGTSD
ncbi:NADPH-dependent FMN reductase [Microbulbifer hydrolyticus]|uniref:Chromate reductase n=1 Tax=Microbulbifer hydrolyticus TaxID=48074 RepID=A0A6P1TC64_9GAMM|nr:NAD(P)H-dependent oxidoreductase [Microbulbifer hydrolyticus]MBB5213010.1 chromate reductase [Microbulbifer hydrolyticus]QHQ40374.1 NADPH-dependent FMN reductase [Microbulbifer hydrolyticus]